MQRQFRGGMTAGGTSREERGKCPVHRVMRLLGNYGGRTSERVRRGAMHRLDRIAFGRTG